VYLFGGGTSASVPTVQALAAGIGTQRFLREAREKVWVNAIALSRAQRQGPDAYRNVLAQLEELSAAKVTALMTPGPVLLKLAGTGFGVRLPVSPAARWTR
jgi:hypothetical protein